MNLLEKYSTECGVKITEPKPASSYFPLRSKKYILIDSRNLYQVNCYDLFQDVLQHIGDILDKQDIEVYNFPQSANNILPSTFPYMNLTKKQEAYIIKNAEVVVACDNVSSYFAASYGVPSIGLYSAYPAACKRPVWGAKHISIESDRCGNLPGYGTAENPKAVNFIKPEEVAKAILEMMGSEEKINVDTLYIGDLYPTKIVEVVPDFHVQPDFLKGKAINLRADYHHNEELLIHWINGRSVNLMIDRPINPSMLSYFKKNVLQVTINLNESFSEKKLLDIANTGIPMEIFCEDDAKLSDWRFKFFDFNIEKSSYKSKNDLDENLNKFNKDTKFISGKVLLSEGKKYSCLEAKKQKKVLTGEPEVVYDTEDFWKELDHYRLINHV
jgi:hypothetical protein